jgi:hypothetical protein
VDRPSVDERENNHENGPVLSPTFDLITNYFAERNVPVKRVEGQEVLAMIVDGANGSFQCSAGLLEGWDLFFVHSFTAEPCPERLRAKMAEFLTRINYGLFSGVFELDLEDGEIRAKTSVDFRGSQLDKALVRNAVETNWLLMDRHLPGLRAVLRGESPLAAAKLTGHSG